MIKGDTWASGKCTISGGEGLYFSGHKNIQETVRFVCF